MMSHVSSQHKLTTNGTRDVSSPKVPPDLSSIVKPEQLVDIVEMTPLTLQDRRIYNLLLAKAWNRIYEKQEHTITRQEITSHVKSHNQDVMASLRRLMAAIVMISIPHNRHGEREIRQVSLLGSNAIAQRGNITYRFPAELLSIIKNTQVFARLHTKVMFELSSKYSLVLYEFLMKRKNLKHISHETLSLEKIRALFGVPDGKLESFGNLHNRAIKPAVQEVSFLTDYEIKAEPMRTGRAVTHVKFSWSQKTDIGAQIAAVEELERSKVGRQERMDGTVESIEVVAAATSDRFYLPSSVIEKAKSIARKAGTGWDIYAIEQQFYDFAKKKGKPDNPEGAFINFVRKKVQKRP